MNCTPVLQLEDVCFGYTDDALALQGVTVAVRPGERIAVLGNNGAGKSTFFLCCNGVLAPKSGTLQLKGEVLGRKKRDLAHLREAVGLVFQDPDDQILASTVEQEISFGPLNLGLDAGTAQQRVDTAIEDMDLAAYRHRPPHYLSGGEKKRVTIADVLAMRPQLTLFDEPTSSLDPAGTRRLQSILNGLSRSGMALMVATHNIDFAYSWAERILVFQAGRLLADAPPLEVFADDALLHAAGLQKPMLYAVAEALCATKKQPISTGRLPKTVEEIPLFLKELEI